MKKTGYMDRAMRSSDPRFAKALGKLGYMGRVPPPDTVDILRAEAKAAGILVDNRWGEARLQEEIAAAKKPKAKSAAEPAKPKKAKSDKLDHDDSGKKGGSRKKDAPEGRYKRRDMKAEE